LLLQGRENVRRITGSVVPRKTEGEIKDAFESRLIEDRAISLFSTRQNSGYPRSRRQLKRYSRSNERQPETGLHLALPLRDERCRRCDDDAGAISCGVPLSADTPGSGVSPIGWRCPSRDTREGLCKPSYCSWGRLPPPSSPPKISRCSGRTQSRSRTMFGRSWVGPTSLFGVGPSGETNS
jgi:hypothetical protein